MSTQNDKDLAEWAEAKQKLDLWKAKEATLRARCFEAFFPTPKEGTTTVELGKGYKLKGVYKLNRNIDEASLSAVLERLPEGSEGHLIKYKPSLVSAAYKNLSAEDKVILEEALTIKPGSPTLTIVAPKAEA